MDTMYFDFYKASYDYGYLKKEDLIEPTKVGCLTKEEYKKITGVDFPKEKPIEPTKPTDKPIQQ